MNNISQLNILDFSSLNSITEIIEKRASLLPDKIAFTYIHTNGEEEILSYSDLYSSSKKIAAYLQENAQKGDRVLLLFPQGLNFIKSFIGCLLAGMVAVPAYPPKKNKNGLGLNRILNDALPRVVLSNSGTGYLSSIKHLDIILCEIDTIEEKFTNSFTPDSIFKNDLAFLQYTSGSTGTPKGVMVSHGNILSNELSIKKVFNMSSEDILVGWLPFYHDMGLIGNILQPLFTGLQHT
jgi:acyl-CoA synthetase (AMP-forming)/AMP-acid ligase II